MTELENRIIVELSKKVVDNIARKYERIRKGVEGIMGGKVIETEAKKMYNRGISEGILLGEENGRSEGIIGAIGILKDLNINVVNIDFDLETNTVFAPGIRKADHNIIPNDEVVVVKDDEVVGVGKAILTGREMEQCTNGIGVKIKHRVKNN